MLFAITDRQEIKKINNIFFDKLSKISDDRINIIYTTAGAFSPIRIWYSANLGFWWGNSVDVKGNRYWNPFGIGKKPKELAKIVGSCQINCSYEGINKSIGGLFAKDDKGNYYVLHSGKFGGGQEGVGKNAFIDYYTGEIEQVVYEDHILNYYVVTKLSDNRFHLNVFNFVNTVYDFKKYIKENIVGKGIKRDRHPLKDGEYLGIKTYNLPAKTVISTNDHARITTTLIEKLRAKGFNVQRDQFRDVYTLNSSTKIDRVFEIKSSFNRQKLYTAIGQLMLHSLQDRSEMYFVIKKGDYGDLFNDLKKIQIKCITYEWQDNKKAINFCGLPRM